ncbi:hypothetical protein GXW83_15205 [Streptacidiphilus sp. PB12-B1b]|uniref:hypothetical protein n=1 Tax=Streptacidiphilus sp. PB12-B1b TaxID=2705012 RepID=UPI0015FD21AB|nr:hypothetical protein [Streptacidiphilus sp. PB12-B1b]QMU76877.1 hypothetical protein GXW83_15205 [Streptacidiphilus sp. PB12-B1b]
MTLPATHECRTCSYQAVLGTTVHEDVVVGAPLSMEDLDDAQRLQRFGAKYAHDKCRVLGVRRVASVEGLSGFGWEVRFVE